MVKTRYLDELHEEILKATNSTESKKEDVDHVFSIVKNNKTITPEELGTLYDITSSFVDYMAIVQNFRNLNMSQYGHQLHDILTRCRWELTMDCRDKWVTFFHWGHGNCYKFNSEKENPLKSNIPGPGFQLNMQFNLEKEDYVRLSPYTTNLIMLIEDQDQAGDVYSYGFPLTPGSYHNIRIKKKIMTRADPHQNNS